MKRTILAMVVLLAGAGCRDEPLEPMTTYQSGELQARAYDFQVYPESRFKEELTLALRRAHLLLNPGLVEAPPMALYETDAAVEDVAKFYIEKYGYGQLAPNEVNDFSAVKPSAFLTTGDLAADAAAIAPIAEKLNYSFEPSRISGTWKGAHITPRDRFPAVSIQRPYIDVVHDRVVDKTLITLMRE